MKNFLHLLTAASLPALLAGGAAAAGFTDLRGSNDEGQLVMARPLGAG